MEFSEITVALSTYLHPFLGTNCHRQIAQHSNEAIMWEDCIEL